jgi:hypothetical protein
MLIRLAHLRMVGLIPKFGSNMKLPSQVFKIPKIGSNMNQCSFISFHEGYGDRQINKIPNIIGYNMNQSNPLRFH